MLEWVVYSRFRRPVRRTRRWFLFKTTPPKWKQEFYSRTLDSQLVVLENLSTLGCCQENWNEEEDRWRGERRKTGKTLSGKIGKRKDSFNKRLLMDEMSDIRGGDHRKPVGSADSPRSPPIRRTILGGQKKKETGDTIFFFCVFFQGTMFFSFMIEFNAIKRERVRDKRKWKESVKDRDLRHRRKEKEKVVEWRSEFYFSQWNSKWTGDSSVT